MLLTRTHPWSPFFQPFQQLHEEMNSLFHRSNEHYLPAINLGEDENAFYLEAELPGLDLSDLEIFVTGQKELTLKGERKPLVVEKGVKHRQERGFGRFARTLTLPTPVDDQAIDARFEQGVLKIRLPKHESAKPRKIAVKG